jgi:nucleotide-binding universal stress UspA family protein
MKSKRILVATTLSKGHPAAFNHALALAHAAGARLYVLHAVPANRAFAEGASHRLAARAELQRRAEQLGVTVDAVEQHGDPAAIIELHANARAVDLIVMGADRTKVSRWLRRPSIAERVVRRTATATLIVPDQDPRRGFGHVLVAVDLSPSARILVEEAAQLTEDPAAQLTVVHVARGIEAATAVQSPARWKVPEYRSHILDDARRHLESALHGVSSVTMPQIRIATGATAKAIVEQADMLGADLVVIGRSGALRPLGSTALQVLRGSQHALLVLPVDDAERRLDVAVGARRAA